MANGSLPWKKGDTGSDNHDDGSDEVGSQLNGAEDSVRILSVYRRRGGSVDAAPFCSSDFSIKASPTHGIGRMYDCTCGEI